jgi:hypothetical protein
MAKSVADRWLDGLSRREYRFSIFGFENHVQAKKFASGLRALRDHKQKLASSDVSLGDLGVRERGDTVELWSSNVEGLRTLAKVAESRGLNTDFIW